MNELNLIGRKKDFFYDDMANYADELASVVSTSSFLVLGGAGSIGQAVVKEIFRRDPRKLHIVDISENNMTELVRDIRSSYGYINGDFKTFPLDIGSVEYDAFIEWDGNYDYVLNLSALKHVRSEKDPFTLMRMINVNILYADKAIRQSINKNSKKFFCVSTDKAANPVNMMGGSKRIMEMYLMSRSKEIDISSARFANVAFSDGSLLHSFKQRMQKNQPIVAPKDIKRYFITPKESGELCLLSCILGENRDIFFPKLVRDLHLISFEEIAVRYLNSLGYEPHICNSEDEARNFNKKLFQNKKWPCFFTVSDTTGEKNFEEFVTDKEKTDLQRFVNLGVIKNEYFKNDDKITRFSAVISRYKNKKKWTKQQLLDLFNEMISDFMHKETGKYLDAKM